VTALAGVMVPGARRPAAAPSSQLQCLAEQQPVLLRPATACTMAVGSSGNAWHAGFNCLRSSAAIPVVSLAENTPCSRSRAARRMPRPSMLPTCWPGGPQSSALVGYLLSSRYLADLISGPSFRQAGFLPPAGAPVPDPCPCSLFPWLQGN
jgi:hypothetical protein